MNRLVAIFLALFAFTGGVTLYAQRAEAEAILPRRQARIGEQVELKLAVRYHEGSRKVTVTWPELKDTITRGVEIVRVDSVHTKMVDRASVMYEQTCKITITAFDSGTYIIPPQRFTVDDETAETQAVELHITSVPVDTTKAIKDIKALYEVPPAPPVVPAEEPVNWWLWSAIAAVVLGGIILLIYLLRKKPVQQPLPVSTRTLLPHEKVLEQLAELGRKKPWLHGELKEYHISLSTILRGWIAGRYNVHAQEMTTGEIIMRLRGIGADPSAVMVLTRVLRTADMVKFAKGIPDNQANEECLQLAMNYVQATAIYPEPPKPPMP